MHPLFIISLLATALAAPAADSAAGISCDSMDLVGGKAMSTGSGFPHTAECTLDNDFIKVKLTAASELTFTSVLVQVYMGSRKIGAFLTPQSRDYEVSCEGQGQSSIDSTPKRLMQASWYNMARLKLAAGITCRFTVIENNSKDDSRAWVRYDVPATSSSNAQKTEEKPLHSDSESIQPASQPEQHPAEQTTDATTQRLLILPADQPAIRATEGPAGPPTQRPTDRPTQRPAEQPSRPNPEALGPVPAPPPRPAPLPALPPARVSRDNGAISVGGKTYQHHCIQDDLARVMMPELECKNYLVASGGKTRAFKSCGSDSQGEVVRQISFGQQTGVEACFDAVQCMCRPCTSFSCPVGDASDSFHVVVYDQRDRQTGEISRDSSDRPDQGYSSNVKINGDLRTDIYSYPGSGESASTKTSPRRGSALPSGLEGLAGLLGNLFK